MNGDACGQTQREGSKGNSKGMMGNIAQALLKEQSWGTGPSSEGDDNPRQGDVAQMSLQRWPLVKVVGVLVQGCHLPELQLLATFLTPTCHGHPTRLSWSRVPASDGQHRHSVLRHRAGMVKVNKYILLSNH